MSTMELEGSHSGTEFECPNCGCDGVPLRGGSQSTCPRCHESFTTQRGDGFVLVERDGWAVTLSLPATTDGVDGEIRSDASL